LEKVWAALSQYLVDRLLDEDIIEGSDLDAAPSKKMIYSDDEKQKYADEPKSLSEKQPQKTTYSDYGVSHQEEEVYSSCGTPLQEKPAYADLELSDKPVYADEEQKYSDDEEGTIQEEPETLDKGNSLYNAFISVNKVPTGKVVIGKYLAAGAFGKVYRGTWGDRLVRP
jgi:hypothetical protein